ncbi:MAG: cytochrome subunit of sulfide dehydrogenase [Pseudomonadota bacterium]|nr:cytochrome subunit of sulfide dehydrogenase [Pseudomonadota bacterium]MDQ5917058.1 cytochrome subunit of sulfide dehydrogenase [Pseudomonadota bacterium]
MRKLNFALSMAALALLAGPAAAQQDPNLARNLVANCANCHGTNGKAVPGAGMEPIAGEPKEKLVKKIKEYRSGVRPATVMHQISKGYTDEQIDLIAGFLAAQK